MAKRHKDQAEEIRQILERSGLEPDELARKVLIKPDTMRKFLHGYQRASGRLMQLIRTVGREEAAKWSAARRDETAEYRTKLQKKLAFIERNAQEPDREAVEAVLETFYKREAAKLREETKK